MTEYVVLVQHKDSPSVWTQFTALSARSARAAISAALEGESNPYASGGTFIAVPARSWLPRQVKVETKTALKFS